VTCVVILTVFASTLSCRVKFVLDIRHHDVEEVTVKFDGQIFPNAHVKDVQPGKAYQLSVSVSR
jgi:hypothetical protein